MSSRVLRTCLLPIALCGAGCTVEVAGTQAPKDAPRESKTIRIDGSSTVAPISAAVSEVFSDLRPDVQAPVNTSGTGGGFDRFARGETDISNASRPIKPEEQQRCRENGIEYVELKVAIDGLSVVVNQDNDWCQALTIDQLRSVWTQEGEASRWQDLDPAWPDRRIELFGPDSKSGTYDYFMEAVIGKEGRLRDYQESVDDNVLATGVAGERYALGFFGFAYYVENRDKLRALAIAPGDDLSAAVEPTQATIEAGRYVPLSRPLFIYVSLQSLQRPEVADFVQFYLSDQGQDLVEVKRYVRLNAEQLSESRRRLDEALQRVEQASFGRTAAAR